jgi:hypothetical protein
MKQSILIFLMVFFVIPAYALDASVGGGNSANNAIIKYLKNNIEILTVSVTTNNIDIAVIEGEISATRAALDIVEADTIVAKADLVTASITATAMETCAKGGTIYKNGGGCSAPLAGGDSLIGSLTCDPSDMLVVDQVTGNFICKKRMEGCKVCVTLTKYRQQHNAHYWDYWDSPMDHFFLCKDMTNLPVVTVPPTEYCSAVISSGDAVNLVLPSISPITTLSSASVPTGYNSFCKKVGFGSPTAKKIKYVDYYKSSTATLQCN